LNNDDTVTTADDVATDGNAQTQADTTNDAAATDADVTPAANDDDTTDDTTPAADDDTTPAADDSTTTPAADDSTDATVSLHSKKSQSLRNYMILQAIDSKLNKLANKF